MKAKHLSSPRVHSLRSRVIVFSLLVSFVIVVIISYGYFSLKSAHLQATNHLTQRDQLLVMITSIRGSLLDSYKDLNNFLLVPENKVYQENILTSIDHAINVSNAIKNHAWVALYHKEDNSRALESELAELKEHINELIAARLDLNTQFPSLQVGAEIMQPNRNYMNNALSLAVNEMHLENSQLEKPVAYRHLIQARYLWTQMLSNFRLYLANRVGSFNEKSLPIQEKGITTLNNLLMSELKKLQVLADNDELGFETTVAIEQMNEASSLWFKGFMKVKEIHKSDEWRYDAKLMKESIAPSIDRSVKQLIEFELFIKESAREDIFLLEQLGRKHNVMLVVLFITFIVFIIMIMYSLNKLIFKPISHVSEALKFEALGKKSSINLAVHSKETDDLINAFSEMSHQVHVRQEELEYHALHDALTSLANRTLLLDRIEHQIISAKRENNSLSLLVIDLDRFKEVNDTLGHIAGDNLLIKVGEVISSSVRAVDTVARFGGDEFSVLLVDTNSEQAMSICRKIQKALSKTFIIDSVEVSIGASIGISLFPDHSDDVYGLLRYADIAMYSAKNNKAGFEIYNPEEDEYTLSRLAMINDLRDAIENKKLDVHYQPVIDMKTDTLVSVEALCRWNHEEFGFVSPETFIELAEQINMINPLSYLVLEKSMETVSGWFDVNPNIELSVNLSVYNLKDSKLLSYIKVMLDKYDFPASKLTLEITESAMMDNPLMAIERLTELKEMGIKLSIDDYGTGFSSMTYLKRLPVNILKIDKSFIIGLDEDSSNNAIAKSTIELAHNLGLKVVAEGIESESVKGILTKYECDFGQGYLFSKPKTSDEILSSWL